MKIFIQRNRQNAWKWIGSGYAHAFIYLDHQVEFIDDLFEIKTDKPYKIFCREDMINESNISILEKSFATYLYVQPNYFPSPWGNHPAWQCHIKSDVIQKLNKLNNIKKWTFCSDLKFFNVWENVFVLPLAFDNINYKIDICENYKYDICFIGGIADNGYNEKIKIIEQTLNSFIDSGLKCGFSVNQNVSHDVENQVLINSKVALNIHDAYQRYLGLDSNERTFKSLGVNGLLVCDNVKQVKDLFPFVSCDNDNENLIKKVKEYCSLSINDLNKIKKENKDMIEREHTYIKRVEKLISYS
jgi:hypothetical protein